jgi:hypothetical protein
MNDLEAAIVRADEANFAALPARSSTGSSIMPAGQEWQPGRAGQQNLKHRLFDSAR